MSIIVLCSAALSSSCSDVSAPDEVSTAPISSVGVSPPSATLNIGGSIPFSATARDAAGGIVAAGFTWSATGGSISNDGLYTAGENLGSYPVVATEAETGLADTAEVTIVSAGILLTNLSPADYEIGRLEQGTQYYVDREFTISSVPSSFEGWLLVKTANDDKHVSNESHISFDLASAAVVAIAYDGRATSLPGWLQEWEEAGSVLGVTDPSLSTLPIHTKSLGPGRVTLGGNNSDGASGAGSHYVLFMDDSGTGGGEPRLTKLEVSPPSVALSPGQSQQYEAQGWDQFGNPTEVTVTWSATGGSITAMGYYTAGGVGGQYRVIATASSGLADTADVTVIGGGGASDRLAVDDRDPHYFTGTTASPLFLLGHGDCPDWFNTTSFLDDLKASYESSGLSYARVCIPIMISTGSVVIHTHERTGPGTAKDGQPKFDITRVSGAFLERLRGVAAWAETHDVYLQISLFAGTAFEGGGLWSWDGAVFNPANRVNPEADNLVATTSGHPNMNDLFNAGAGWRSAADRAWIRDRSKHLVDRILQALEPYGNWWIEIGNENTADVTFKRYWAHYIRGDAHSIDDGAVSPYANPDYLVGDNSDFGGDIVSTGYVESQQDHHADSGNIAATSAELYGDGILFIHSADGASDAQKTGREAQRRAAWISLSHGGHYDAFNNRDNPRSSAAYLGDLGRLMTFLRSDRGGHTIEATLTAMRPAAGEVTSGHALESKPGEPERYLIFAAAGTNPSVTVETVGLTILRLDTTTGVEEVVGTTQAGTNVLSGTGQDTAWWIE